MTDSIIHSLDTANAPLPVVYENAKNALSQCSNIDECVDWADKALALASYARQVDDDELERLANRIRARAIRRCGELLASFDGQGKRNDLKLYTDGDTKSSAATKAGLSKRQKDQAVNMANLMAEDFEALVDADEPLSPSEIAEKGKREYLSKKKPEGFADAIYFKGSLQRLFEKTEEFEPLYILGGMSDDDKSECKALIDRIEVWFDKFICNS